MTKLLETRGLEAFYGQTRALHGLDFDLREGSVTTILGANGAGKTTTLRAVCGMIRTAGEIRFDGKPIRGRATEDVVRLGIAHVPEGRGTFVRLTVEENLRLGAITRGGGRGVVVRLRCGLVWYVGESGDVALRLSCCVSSWGSVASSFSWSSVVCV